MERDGRFVPRHWLVFVDLFGQELVSFGQVSVIVAYAFGQEIDGVIGAGLDVIHDARGIFKYVVNPK